MILSQMKCEKQLKEIQLSCINRCLLDHNQGEDLHLDSAVQDPMREEANALGLKKMIEKARDQRAGLRVASNLSQA